MTEAMQREEKARLSSSRTKAIRLILAGTAIFLFAASVTALHGQGPDSSKAADNKTQLSPQEQSMRRDQSYVRKLLERGTSDSKIETSLQITSRFTSFNSSGDFHAYVLGLVAKEKKTLEQAKQSQQPSVTTLAVLALLFLTVLPVCPPGMRPLHRIRGNQQRESFSREQQEQRPKQQPGQRSRQQRNKHCRQ